ncbi:MULTISPECIES: SlyX family protein [unclassified Roseitalea]|uniref:SlyX family protein n=1 Tax=unclassified Roseitalea TaxID=2639107 RepID=UPI00273E1221|nr:MULTISPECIES: SlyX family protein [unclassified Roseitalea]
MARTQNERLDELEIQVAHQARTIDELNEVVTAQDAVIADLSGKLEALRHRFGELERRLGEAPPVDRPPHW